MKYNLGVTRVQDGSGTWKPLKGAWIQQANGEWAPIQAGWVRLEDGTWERIYPTPMGVFAANVSEIDHTYYQYYPDTGSTVLVTNTGEFDLTINNVVVNDETTGHVTELSGTLPNFPITLAPSETVPLTFKVTGNTIGTYGTGNVQFINHIGYLGYANATINTQTVVKPTYPCISIVGDNPAIIAYVGNDEIKYAYSGYSQKSLTIPAGVTSIQVIAAGGGGGGGGNDRLHGAPGYQGHEVSGIISVTPGDAIGVYIGQGGANGSNGSSTPGGAGGSSYNGYSGGQGGPAGGGGWSGSGGGGGAATVITVNGTDVVVAAGGGGGGGGGNYGYGLGQYQTANGTSHTGANGASRGGSDGGGPGGGAGGYPGGAAGAVAGGDVGSYSGSDGYDLAPVGTTVGRANNGGSISGTGGDGYAKVIAQGLGVTAAQTVTIRNSGNGGNLVIASITSQNGYFEAYDLTSSAIGFDFSNYTGNTAQFTIAPYTTMSIGTYQDTIIINSNAADYPVYKIPVTVTVTQANGNKVFTQPGLQTWVVPANVHYIDLFLVGGGGGGGYGNNGYNAGTGGGGGSGAYSTLRQIAVNPGETLTISVGDGGVSTGGGQSTTISGSFGSYTVAGGNPGGSGYPDPTYADWSWGPWGDGGGVGDGAGGDGGE